MERKKSLDLKQAFDKHQSVIVHTLGSCSNQFNGNDHKCLKTKPVDHSDHQMTSVGERVKNVWSWLVWQ